MSRPEPVVHQRTIEINTKGKGFTNITPQVAAVVAASRADTGLCALFLQHTSASLLIQENADPAVLRDLERWMEELAPESDLYEHDAEGRDDMPSHLRSSITRTSETIPIMAGRLGLGTWQGIYLWEHRARSHTRHVIVTVVGRSP